MRAPPVTYQFQTLKDTSGPTIEVVSRTAELTVAQLALQMNLRGIPKDKIFVLTSATVSARPGVAQSLVQLDILGTTQALQLFNIKNEKYPVLDLEPRSMAFSGEVWIHGAGGNLLTLSLVAVFDGDAAANVASFGIQGFVIPRGNAAVF